MRIVAAPGSKPYGRLSVLANWRCEAKIMFDVSPPPSCRRPRSPRRWCGWSRAPNRSPATPSPCRRSPLPPSASAARCCARASTVGVDARRAARRSRHRADGAGRGIPVEGFVTLANILAGQRVRVQTVYGIHPPSATPTAPSYGNRGGGPQPKEPKAPRAFRAAASATPTCTQDGYFRLRRQQLDARGGAPAAVHASRHEIAGEVVAAAVGEATGGVKAAVILGSVAGNAPPARRARKTSAPRRAISASWSTRFCYLRARPASAPS